MSATTQDLPSQIPEVAGKTAVTALASLAPLYLLLGIKNRAGLDQLHIGLIQLLFVIFFRYILGATRLFGALKSRTLRLTSPSSNLPSSKLTKKKKTKKKKAASYSSSLLDETLHRFLAIIEPEQGVHIPTPKPQDSPPAFPLEDWKPHYESNGISVSEHPNLSSLYAVSAHLPDVSLKRLFGLLIDVSSRPLWDGLTESAEQLEEVRDGHGRVASVSYMRMKGMWPVKPKDLVILSVLTRLPPVGSSPGTKPIIRIACATTSVTHESKPAQSGYTRMSLAISGFLIEEDGLPNGGSRIVQITDLSGLGKVPNFIITTVTQKMIPASLKKLGRVASTYKSNRFPDNDEKDESWMLPLIGDWIPGKDVEATAALKEAAEEEEDDEEEGEEEGDLNEVVDSAVIPTGQAKNLRMLIAQLKLVTSRLSDLEGQSRHNLSASQGSWLRKRLGWSNSSSNSSNSRSDTTGQLHNDGKDQNLVHHHSWTDSVGVTSVALATVAAGAATWVMIRKRWK